MTAKKKPNKITVFGGFIQSVIIVVLVNWYLKWTLTGFELFIMIVTYLGAVGVWELVGIFRLRSMPKPPRQPKIPPQDKGYMSQN
ncbi:MAG: hypothetical protein KAU06_04760 [Candidatus Marinimicrobia bacterium]|nr:hypothetical protein [Candidatus Neomarinimicrobiota bacterium]